MLINVSEKIKRSKLTDNDPALLLAISRAIADIVQQKATDNADNSPM